MMHCMHVLLLLLVACASVALSSPNSGIVVKNRKGQVFTSYSVEKYDTPQELYCSLSNRFTQWSIAPEDKGVTMNGEMIMIDTSKVLPKTVFTITALDNGQTTTLPFEIEVLGCKYGTFTHISKDVSNVNFQLYHDSELLYDGAFKSKYFCLPRSTFRYTSVSNQANYLIVTDEDGARLHTNYFATYSKFEGTFSNVLDAPIAISFPSVVSLLPNVEKTLLVSTSGLVDSVKVEPELPVDEKKFTVKVVMPSAGTTTYTITASRGSQSVQKTFTVYCGSCPEGTTLVTATPDNKLMWYNLPEVEGPVTHKEQQTFCVSGSAFTASYHSTKDTPLVFSKDGHVFFEYYPMDPSVNYQSLSVEWRTPVAFASPLAFLVGSASKRWSEPGFDEKGWKQGSEGAWGAFDASGTAFFRAAFALDTAAGFTNVAALLRGEGNADVYINGAFFGSASLRGANATRFVIPVSYAVAGNNVLAVRLAKGAAATISFALSVELNNAPVLRLTEGAASAISSDPDESHPERAFGSDDYYTVYWTARTFPSELVFTFDAPQVVNRVRMMRNPFWKTFTLQLVGVTGSEKVALAVWNQDSIAEASQGFESSTLFFTNNRAFQSYHFVVNSRCEDCTVYLTGIRLYHDVQYTCPKKWGYKNMLEGTTVFKSCPLGYTGRRARSCVHEGAGAQWVDSKAQCFSTNPPKGTAYVDWSFTLRGMTPSFWETKGREEFIAMLTEKTYLRVGDVSFLYADSAVDGEVMVMRVFSRCSVMSLMGKVIEYNLNEITPQFSELVGAKLGERYSGSIDEMTLRHYVNWTLVIVISVVVLVVVVAVAAYIATRNKTGGLKTLRKRANEDASLLVLCVCWRNAPATAAPSRQRDDKAESFQSWFRSHSHRKCRDHGLLSFYG